MIGKCDKCDGIFDSHDGGWICPICGEVYCPKCEIMPEGADEPICPKCEEAK